MPKFFRKFLQCRKIWNTLGQNQNLWDRIGIFLHFSYIFLHRKCVHLVPAVRTKNTATTTTVRMTPSNNNDTTTNKFIMVIIWRLIQQQIAIHQQIYLIIIKITSSSLYKNNNYIKIVKKVLFSSLLSVC